MATSNAHARWKGTLKEGEGKMSFTGYEGSYSFSSRFEKGEGTNPEELIGAAHAGCFSMYLSLLLTQEGLNPEDIQTWATVKMGEDDTGPHIQEINLQCKVKCKGLSDEKLQELAQTTKEKCPVSRLYAGGTATIESKVELIS